ncbi:MAG: SDR family oxidoreductase [Vulcanimicrobiota bacterium]
MTKVLVTGGAGYVGAALVPKLLERGFEVVVFDLMLFGSSSLPKHPSLKIVVGDIRDTAHFEESLEGCNIVLHLAAISNDPSFELDPELARTINYDSFEPLVAACVRQGVARFIFASSSSVYGVSENPDVTEKHPLVPLTDYSRYKALCEPILFKYQSPDFTTLVLRPATVCGYSPRLRLDLSVNILTNHAVNKRLITVFGGAQKRPNIHIDDICDVYVAALNWPQDKIAGEIFNVGYQNHSIADLAMLVKRVVESEVPGKEIEIVTQDSPDLRSYHVSSEKIAEVLGYRPEKTIEDAVRDLCRAFKAGKIPDPFGNENYYNVKIQARSRT